eukprot:268145-Prymnesium_polylepis.1
MASSTRGLGGPTIASSPPKKASSPPNVSVRTVPSCTNLECAALCSTTVACACASALTCGHSASATLLRTSPRRSSCSTAATPAPLLPLSSADAASALSSASATHAEKTSIEESHEDAVHPIDVPAAPCDASAPAASAATLPAVVHASAAALLT